MSDWPDPARCRAVLVGTTTYTDQVMWPALPAVRANITDLGEVLTGPRSWHLSREHCAQLIDPTSSDHVLDLIHDAATEAADTVFIYYSGHGEKTENDLLLPIATTRPDRLRIGGVRFSVIREIIRERRAPRAVVVLDCCYSGMAHGMSGSALRGLIDTTSAFVLTSSARDTLSLAPPGERHTAFTGELLKIMQDGVSAGPDHLTIGDVTRALRFRLLDRRLPLPEFSQSGPADQLLLVRNRPAPGPVRAEFVHDAPGIRLAGAGRRTGRAVGICFGTTNSVVSVIEGGEPTVIPNAEGSRTTPSVVGFAKNGEILVGEAAKRQAVTNTERTIHSIKREMGTGWSAQIDGKTFSPQQIAAFVLRKLKQDAEAHLGEKITDAVITVPAYFDDAQRQATMEAGTIAGLNVLRVINEPTAAALAYGLDEDQDRTVLVFDLGGGTLDVSLLYVGPGYVEVKACAGDHSLGGDDWDQRIVDELVKRFKNASGIDLARDRMALQRLGEAAEKAKIELSSQSETHISLPYIAVSAAQGPLYLDTTLTRLEFQRLTADLLGRIRAPFREVVEDSVTKVSDIAHVVLTGGSTRMPAVSALVKELTGGKEPRTGGNPDEVVAVGAAWQASVLKADVTPLTLGLKGKDGVLRKIIERDTLFPVQRSITFTTTADGQSSLRVQVYEGEQEVAALNAVLATYTVNGITAAPRGVPRIEVTFGVDADLTFTVSARELATGRPLPVSQRA